MNIYHATEYLEHGCNIRGNLVIADYWSDMVRRQNSTPGGGFGQTLHFDFAEAALQEIKKGHPNAGVLLNAPDLVCRI